MEIEIATWLGTYLGVLGVGMRKGKSEAVTAKLNDVNSSYTIQGCKFMTPDH